MTQNFSSILAFSLLALSCSAPINAGDEEKDQEKNKPETELSFNKDQEAEIQEQEKAVKKESKGPGLGTCLLVGTAVASSVAAACLLTKLKNIEQEENVSAKDFAISAYKFRLQAMEKRGQEAEELKKKAELCDDTFKKMLILEQQNLIQAKYINL